MRKVIILLVLLSVFGIAFSVVFAESCSKQSVKIKHHAIFSEALNEDLQFDVYIPPCMDERIGDGYPVVYLFHGQDMDIRIWKDLNTAKIMKEMINSRELPLFYLVVPQEDHYLLSLSLSGFGDAVLDTLIPWVDAHYNTCTKKQCRALGGLSRGALWAEKIAFEHPTYFGSLALLSMPGTIIDDQSIYYLAEKHKPDQMLRIRLDVGSEDNYRHEAIRASSQLNYIGYPYEYTMQPGDHDETYWSSMLEEYFIWFSRGWENISLPLQEHTPQNNYQKSESVSVPDIPTSTPTIPPEN